MSPASASVRSLSLKGASAPKINSSAAKPAKSSRVLVPASPRVTSISGVRPFTAARSSATPSFLRFLSASFFRFSRASTARCCNSDTSPSSNPSMATSSSASTNATSSSSEKPSTTRSWARVSSTSRVLANILLRVLNSSWRRSDSSASVRMSITQPVSFEASLTFCPRRPMASESWSSGTTTSIRRSSSSRTTLTTWAGARAFTIRAAGSWVKAMMSIFSPWSSLTTA